MKKAIPVMLSLVAIVMSALAVYFATASTELVYVDVTKLMDGYNRTKEVKSEFDKKSTQMKANVDSLMTNWQDELKKYEKEKSSFTAMELKLKQEILENKQRQISGYQQSVQGKIQEENQKMTQTLINDINDYTKEFGKSHGYKIIFGATGSGNIMYAQESSDITDKILKGLNAQYAKK